MNSLSNQVAYISQTRIRKYINNGVGEYLPLDQIHLVIENQNIESSSELLAVHWLRFRDDEEFGY